MESHDLKSVEILHNLLCSHAVCTIVTHAVCHSHEQVTVFWACGVTSQVAIMEVHLLSSPQDELFHAHRSWLKAPNMYCTLGQGYWSSERAKTHQQCYPFYSCFAAASPTNTSRLVKMFLCIIHLFVLEVYGIHLVL